MRLAIASAFLVVALMFATAVAIASPPWAPSGDLMAPTTTAADGLSNPPGEALDMNGDDIVLDVDGDLIVAGDVDDVMGIDNTGATVNSPLLSLTGDVGGTEVEGGVQLIQGTDPIVRISVDDDSTTPVLTTALDITDTVTTFAGTWVTADVGPPPTCDATELGKFWYDANSIGTDTVEICLQTDGTPTYAWTDMVASGSAFDGDLNGNDLSDSTDTEVSLAASTTLAFGASVSTTLDGTTEDGVLGIRNQSGLGQQGDGIVLGPVTSSGVRLMLGTSAANGVYVNRGDQATVGGVKYPMSVSALNAMSGSQQRLILNTVGVKVVSGGTYGFTSSSTSAATVDTWLARDAAGAIIAASTAAQEYMIATSFIMKEDGATLPTCAADIRGAMWHVNGSGVGDSAELCAQEHDGNTAVYNWRSLGADPYAYISVTANATSTSTGAGGFVPFVDASGDFWNEGDMSGFDWEGDAVDEQLTTDVAGRYVIIYNASFISDTGNVDYRFAVGVNGTETCGYSARKIGTGADVGNTSGSCVVDLAVGDEVVLMVDDTTGTTNNPTLEEANLTIRKL